MAECLLLQNTNNKKYIYISAYKPHDGTPAYLSIIDETGSRVSKSIAISSPIYSTARPSTDPYTFTHNGHTYKFTKSGSSGCNWLVYRDDIQIANLYDYCGSQKEGWSEIWGQIRYKI